MRKQSIYKLLCLVIIFSIVINLVPFNSFADDAFAISLHSVNGLKGEYIYVNVYFDNVPSSGISSGIFYINYDISKLTFDSLASGQIIPNDNSDISYSIFSSGIKIMYSDYDQTGSSYISSNGVFCTLCFLINKDCPDGIIPLTVYSKDTFYDKDVNEIGIPSFGSGNVTVWPLSTPTPEKQLIVKIGDNAGSQEESVSVAVYFKNVPSQGISSCIFDIDYDNSKLSYYAYTSGDILYNSADVSLFANPTPANSGKLRIMYSDILQTGSSHIMKDGVFCNITFKINETCPDGITILTPLYIEEFYDKNVNGILTPTFIPGIITVCMPSVTATPTPSFTTTPSSTPAPSPTTAPSYTPTPSPVTEPSSTSTPNPTSAPTNKPSFTPTPTQKHKSKGGGGTFIPESSTSTPAPTLEPTKHISKLTPIPSDAPIFYVSPDKYPSKIQDAINDAPSGSTIMVSKGTYHENIIVNKKTLTIKGEDVNNTIIDGGDFFKSVLSIIQTDNFVLENFTINNGIKGIQFDNSNNNKISNCIIKSNQFEGISFSNSSSSNTIFKCSVESNTTGIDLGDFKGQLNNTISNCKISSNTEYGIKGLSTTTGTKIINNDISLNKKSGIFVGGSEWTIEKNSITSNSSSGILVDAANITKIRDNKILNNQSGIILKGEGTEIIGNIFDKNKSSGITIMNASIDTLISNNSFLGSGLLAQDQGTNTRWNLNSQGNYWENYNGKDQNGDKIGDTPYIISDSSNIKDFFPLMSITIIPDIQSPFGPMLLSDIKGHWAESQLVMLHSRNIVSGYFDNTLKPNNPITRYELVTAVIKALGLTPTDNTTSNFKDEIPKWAKNFVCTAYSKGFINGYEDGKFRGSKNITRAEALTVILKSAGKSKTESIALEFADKNSIPNWAKGYFCKAHELELIKGYSDNTIRPNNNITRAEAFSLICRILLQ